MKKRLLYVWFLIFLLLCNSVCVFATEVDENGEDIFEVNINDEPTYPFQCFDNNTIPGISVEGSVDEDTLPSGTMMNVMTVSSDIKKQIEEATNKLFYDNKKVVELIAVDISFSNNDKIINPKDGKTIHLIVYADFIVEGNKYVVVWLKDDNSIEIIKATETVSTDFTTDDGEFLNHKKGFSFDIKESGIYAIVEESSNITNNTENNQNQIYDNEIPVVQNEEDETENLIDQNEEVIGTSIDQNEEDETENLIDQNEETIETSINQNEEDETENLIDQNEETIETSIDQNEEDETENLIDQNEEVIGTSIDKNEEEETETSNDQCEEYDTTIKTEEKGKTEHSTEQKDTGKTEHSTEQKDTGKNEHSTVKKDTGKIEHSTEKKDTEKTKSSVDKTEKTKVSVDVKWEDTDNQDGIRPKAVSIRLLANGKKVDETSVTEKEEWKCTFENLPKFYSEKEIVYTIEQKEIKGYKTENRGFDVINSHAPETIMIEGVVMWDDSSNKDGIRPQSIDVNLIVDGNTIDTATVSKKSDWKYSFGTFAKYEAGREIVYTIIEENVEGYTPEYYGFNINNTHKADSDSSSSPKVGDSNNILLWSIVVILSMIAIICLVVIKRKK